VKGSGEGKNGGAGKNYAGTDVKRSTHSQFALERAKAKFTALLFLGDTPAKSLIGVFFSKQPPRSKKTLSTSGKTSSAATPSSLLRHVRACGSDPRLPRALNLRPESVTGKPKN